MSRPIKFRAWDIDLKEWHFYEGVHNSIECGMSEMSELMQYTGQKDKNGKEIYEGDIVLSGSADGFKSPYEVFWNINAWNIRRFEDDGETFWNTGLYFTEQETFGVEIIGNKYESPELLVKTK